MKPESTKGIRRKVRNSFIISTVSIAMVLFLLGSVGYLILNALAATERMKESITVYVMLKDGATQSEVAEVGKYLASMEPVRKSRFVTRDEAAKEFVEYTGSDFPEMLKGNPLPDFYELNIRAAYSGVESISRIDSLIMLREGVDEVLYQRGVIEQITTNINKFNLILLLFGGALLVITLILLNNTIRISIFAKRYIINTMKLVGATRGYIMRPFLAASVRQGLYAALIAGVMFVAMVAGLQEGLPELKFTTGTLLVAAILGSMLICGVLISVLFTTFAVGKFIRMRSSQIHLY